MSISDNIGRNLDKQFENFNYLPQRIELDDMGMALKKSILDIGLSVPIETGMIKQVPVIHVMQELWAERKMNWGDMRNEQGEEVTRPFMTLYRLGVKPGTSPIKYTIPKKKKFRFVKVPKFDGTLKGFDIWKIPQPRYVDVLYELRMVTHYLQHVDDFYEAILRDGYSDGERYISVGGYNIATTAGEPSEENTVDDITQERVFEIVFPITIYGKLIDPTKFEKVNTINKISIKITEK